MTKRDMVLVEGEPLRQCSDDFDFYPEEQPIREVSAGRPTGSHD